MAPERSSSRLPRLPSVDAERLVSLQDEVTRVVRDAIVSGRLRPGERIMQVPLAEQLNVSRQPVREALRRLQADGLIHLTANRGFAVKSYSDEDIRENYMLRALLEGQAAYLAAGRLSTDVVDELSRISAEMNRMYRTDELGRAAELNAAFHSRIAAATGMQTLQRLIESLWIGHTVLTPIFVQGRAIRSIAEHAEVLEALIAGDARKARTAMREHIMTGSRDYFEQRSGIEDSDDDD